MDRKKIATFIVVLFTVVLAAVAVFTAVRLYQQRQVPIAPSAPTSIPRAQEAQPTATPVPPTTSCEIVSFALGGPKCGDACTNDADCPGTDHKCSGGKCVLATCLNAGTTCDSTNCSVTTTPGCGDTCTTNSQCPTDHTCNSSTKKCELSICLESGRTCNTANCALTPKCGDTCSNNSQCPTDHTCSTNGKCVLSSCLSEGASCTANNCQTTSAQPELPKAGTGFPTILAGLVGVLAIIGALALAL